MDRNTSDIIKLGGQIVLADLTYISHNILKTQQISDSWHEAKIVILFKKKKYRPIRLMSHSYKIFIVTKYSQDTYRLESKELWIKTSQESKQDSEKAILHQTNCKL